MNQRLIRFGVPALVLSTLLCGCIQPTPPSITEEHQTTAQSVATDSAATPVFIYQSMEYRYKTNVSGTLDAILTNLNPSYLLLVNQEHLLAYTGLYRMLRWDKCHEEKKQIRDQCVTESPISAKVVREAFPGKVFLE